MWEGEELQVAAAIPGEKSGTHRGHVIPWLTDLRVV